jgi:hypothetical protein
VDAEPSRQRQVLRGGRVQRQAEALAHGGECHRPFKVEPAPHGAGGRQQAVDGGEIEPRGGVVPLGHATQPFAARSRRRERVVRTGVK